MKVVHIFNPIHVLGNKISVSVIDGLKIIKFSDHPEISVQIEVMKTEVMKYQTHEERNDIKGKDTFDLSDWWKSNCVTLPTFAFRVSFSADQLTQLWSRSEKVSDRLHSIIHTTSCMKLPLVFMREPYSDMDLEIDESVTYCSQSDMDLEID
jgi:hypothetical protein